MPHQVCSVCAHSDRQTIDEALMKGLRTQRALADQFGLKKTSIARHALNHMQRIPAKNADAKAIDREIQRLLRAQRQQRGRAEQITISRELRNWYTLKAKLEVRDIAATPEGSQEMSRGEALEIAKALIESETASGSPEILVWIRGLLDRLEATKTATVTADAELKPHGLSIPPLVSHQATAMEDES